jgi:zinc transport system substrate-binding protein
MPELRLLDLRDGIELRRMGHHHHGEADGHHHADEDADGHHHAHGDADGHGHAAPHEAREGTDPHTWMSPANLKIQARSLAAAFAADAAASREAYEANLATLEAELDTLDRELRETLAPARGKAFLVFHPSYGYLADAYGLEQRAVEAEGKAPVGSALADLIREAREADSTTIFVQSGFDTRAAHAIARALGGRVETLDPLARNVPENLRAIARKLARALGE